MNLLTTRRRTMSTWQPKKVEMGAASRTRCGVGLLDHDVCTGNQWRAIRDERGDVVAIVDGKGCGMWGVVAGPRQGNREW